MKFSTGLRDVVDRDEAVNDIEAHVVAGALITAARVAESNYDVHDDFLSIKNNSALIASDLPMRIGKTEVILCIRWPKAAEK